MLVAFNVPVTVLLPVMAAPPADTVKVLVEDKVPVTATLPVIVAPPEKTVAPEKVTTPALEIVTRVVPPVANKSPREPGEFIVELDASADMVVRDVPLLDSWITPSLTSKAVDGDCVPRPTRPAESMINGVTSGSTLS